MCSECNVSSFRDERQGNRPRFLTDNEDKNHGTFPKLTQTDVERSYYRQQLGQSWQQLFTVSFRSSQNRTVASLLGSTQANDGQPLIVTRRSEVYYARGHLAPGESHIMASVNTIVLRCRLLLWLRTRCHLLLL